MCKARDSEEEGQRGEKSHRSDELGGRDWHGHSADAEAQLGGKERAPLGSGGLSPSQPPASPLQSNQKESQVCPFLVIRIHKNYQNLWLKTTQICYITVLKVRSLTGVSLE